MKLNQFPIYRFDPQLEELFESHQAIVSNLTDSRVGSMYIVNRNSSGDDLTEVMSVHRLICF
jgi:hypothetical protein